MFDSAFHFVPLSGTDSRLLSDNLNCPKLFINDSVLSNSIWLSGRKWFFDPSSQKANLSVPEERVESCRFQDAWRAGPTCKLLGPLFQSNFALVENRLLSALDTQCTILFWEIIYSSCSFCESQMLSSPNWKTNLF